MGFWAWFWIWAALIVASLAVLGIIGKSLFNRSLDVFHQINRIAEPTKALMAALETKPTIEERESSLLTPANELDSKRLELLKKKTKKRALRQRSLRTALKNIDVNESRFTND